MDTNGAGPSVASQDLQAHLASAQDKTRRLTSDLRGLLAEEEMVVQELTREMEAARKRRDHLRRALDHLTGETRKFGRPPKNAEPQRDSRPRPATMHELLGILIKAEKPLTHTELTDRSSVSTETVTRALRYLREEEKVRVAGKPGQRGQTYLAMPDAELGSGA